MSLNGDGTYTLPSPAFPAVPETIIESESYNEILLDIQSALSLALYRDGQAVWTGVQNAGGFGLSAGTGGAQFQGAWEFLESPTAPTPAPTDDSTKLATTEWVNQVSFASSLPGQGGNAGKWLTTDGTDASWQWIGGKGGATITGNVTLTVTSPAAMKVTPTGYGLYATLPDPTTVEEWAVLFSFENVGIYPYGVKDNTGVVLGWILPGNTGTIGLASVAGGWTLNGFTKAAVTAEYLNSGIVTDATPFAFLAVDADRVFFLFGSTSLYGLVYNKTTNTWGSPTLIAVATNGKAVLSGTDQILVAYSNNTTIFAVTLTLAGVGITPNTGTGTSQATGGTSGSIYDLVAVGASFAIVGERTSAGTNHQYVTAIGVVLTAPSMGTALTFYSSGGAVEVYQTVTGTTVRAIVADAGADTLSVYPVAVSGVTSTLGTHATTTMDTNNTALNFSVNSLGDLVIVFERTDIAFVTISKLTLTTEVFSTITTGVTLQQSINDVEVLQLSSGKTLLTITTPSNVQANIITDTAGTVSLGTAVTFAGTSGNIGVISGNTVTILSDIGTDLFRIITLDCSGSSPIHLSSKPCQGNVSGFSGLQKRPASRLQSGLVLRFLGTLDTTVSQTFSIQSPTIPRLPVLTQPDLVASASWGLTLSTSPGTLVIQRVEMTA